MRYCQIGTEAKANNWSLSEWAAAGKRILNNGFDTVLFKVMDGSPDSSNPAWYTSAQMQAIYNVFKNMGLNPIPYTWLYGNAAIPNTNATGDLNGEIVLTVNILKQFGCICLDMEEYWNAQTGWAAFLVQALHTAFPQLPKIYISTWANIGDQQWQGVAKILDPAVAGWMPQVYTPYLVSVWQQQWAGIKSPIMPTYRPLTMPSNPTGNWGLWEYGDLSDKEIPVNLVLNSQGCVCDVLRSLQTFENEMELCGPWAAKAIQLAGFPGKGATGVAEDIDTWVDVYVTKEGFTPANFPGVSVPDMEAIFKALGLHYWEINPSVSSIRKAIGAGYPVIFTANEANIWRWNGTGWEFPYDWQINANHVIPATGFDNNGNLKCPDQLSSRNPWPVIYDASRINPSYAVIVQLPFLKTIPSGNTSDTVWNGFNAQITTPPVPTPPVVNNLAAFNQEWSQGGTYDATSGIAQTAYKDYKTTNFHGVPTGQEFDLGANRAMVVTMGIWIWDKTTHTATFHKYY